MIKTERLSTALVAVSLLSMNIATGASPSNDFYQVNSAPDRPLSSSEMDAISGSTYLTACNNYQCPARKPTDPVPTPTCDFSSTTGNYSVTVWTSHLICGAALEVSCDDWDKAATCSVQTFYDNCTGGVGSVPWGTPITVPIDACA
jgi:hypothetical protein